MLSLELLDNVKKFLQDVLIRALTTDEIKLNPIDAEDPEVSSSICLYIVVLILYCGSGKINYLHFKTEIEKFISMFLCPDLWLQHAAWHSQASWPAQDLPPGEWRCSPRHHHAVWQLPVQARHQPGTKCYQVRSGAPWRIASILKMT